MRKSPIVRFLIVIALLPPIAHAAATIDAKALHDSACLGCHKPDMYTRKDRIVDSPEALSAQVGRCQVGAKEHWNAAQIDAVTAYLNNTYYKFK